MGIGAITGRCFCAARDTLARGLLKIGVTPNALTFTGLVFTAAAGVMLAVAIRLSGGNGVGFDWWGRAHGYFGLAAALLIASNACDMLDGAVARIGNRSSAFGGFLDSSFDRLADFFMWTGPAVGYALLEKPNLTFILLCLVANLNCFMISYTKCRAEDFIDRCAVGFWRRGERCAAVLIATLACNPSMAAVMIALSGPFTWFRRIAYTRSAMRSAAHADPRDGSLLERIQPWRWPRTTLPWDAAVIGNISLLLFLRVDPAEWDLLGSLVAG